MAAVHRERSALVIASIVLGLCLCAPVHAAGPASLEELLSFDDPARCEPSATQTAFLGALTMIDPAGDEDTPLQPGSVAVPRALAGSFGGIEMIRGDGWTTVDLPVSGYWHGLELRGVRQTFPYGGDAPATELIFAESEARVAEVARSLGFPPDGTVIDDDSYSVYTISFIIEPDRQNPELVRLTCAWG